MNFFRESISNGKEAHLYFKEASNTKIRLDLTTNPLGFPKSVLRCMDSFSFEKINRYPNPPELPELVKAISSHLGIIPEEIMITGGADIGIEVALTHILDSGDVLAVQTPTFPRFGDVAKRLCSSKVEFFKGLDIPNRCKAVVLCTPNNPTTEELNLRDVKSVVEENQNKMFLVDGAFADFGKDNMSTLIKNKNVIVLKSLSKSFGMPGIRMGWIESCEENIRFLRRGVSPFQASSLSQEMALVALNDRTHVTKTKKFLDSEFDKIKKILGGRVFRKSSVPFFILFTEEPERIQSLLLTKGISVITSKSFEGVERRFLRIMIGRKEENRILLSVLEEFMDGRLI